MSQETEQQAQQLMEDYNTAYRAGNPTISDGLYDFLLDQYAKDFPNNPFFNQQEVEPEPEVAVGKTCKLPQKMLSTQKAYTIKEIEKFLDDVIAVGASLGIKNIAFRITPKYDGYAAFRQDKQLFTRGDGINGTDISRALLNGLKSPKVAQAFDNNGAGEIVCNKAYFKEHLADTYENSRNIIAGAIREGALEPKIAEALRTGNIMFVPFNNSWGWLKSKEEVLRDLEEMWDEVANKCLYDTDGLVIETISEQIRVAMGDTNHHHRYQIAFKKNQEYHNIEVLDLQWQTGKSGVITPVVLLEPTKISGVTVSKATGHNALNVIEMGIDSGAIVRVCRSGLVIPYIESVIKSVEDVYIPHFCPSCGSPTDMGDTKLTCTNTIDCPAQVEGTIEFFFKTIKVDGFGPAICEKLCSQGIEKVSDIYAMGELDFFKLIGGQTGKNLFKAVKKSRELPIEDWRFLAAFSLNGHGKGNSEKILTKFALDDIFNLTVADIVTIDGFADKSAKTLVYSLDKIKPEFDILVAGGFKLVETIRGGTVKESPISGKVVVFTGKMVQGSRNDMASQAKALGAKVGTTVTSSTDILICGENVGASKTTSAEKNGTLVISEAEYLEMLK